MSDPLSPLCLGHILTGSRILGKVAFACALFDQDGMYVRVVLSELAERDCSQIRFLNSTVQGNNINSEQAVMSLVGQIKFSGASTSPRA